MASNLSLLQSLHPDAIHDIRVTSRRTRALFSELKTFFHFPEELISTAKTITRLLGKRRELDVIKELALKLFPGDSLFTVHFCNFIDKKRELEYKNCIKAVELVERAIEFSRVVPDLPQVGECCYVDFLYQRVLKLLNQLTKVRKKVKKIVQKEELISEELHLIRISLKKIRYSFEISSVLISGIKQFIPKIKEVQETLGEWNDNRVLLNYFKDFLSFNPSISDTYIDELNKNLQIIDNKIKEKVNEICTLVNKNFKKQYLNDLWEDTLKEGKEIKCCIKKGKTYE
ncbi:MAG: CHAD domain-containing protein [Candidatus Hydrogenedentes bacterium]|nr:CHAD domain-containing protein [Candidatus Hydrogenedentota bacterium]